jgi:hypothetical protein
VIVRWLLVRDAERFAVWLDGDAVQGVGVWQDETENGVATLVVRDADVVAAFTRGANDHLVTPFAIDDS